MTTTEEMDTYPEFRKTRYAYKHRRDPERFGLLEAVSYQDAQRHLGSAFYIRTVLLPWDCGHPDREQKRKIVDEVFRGDNKRRPMLALSKAEFLRIVAETLENETEV
jgi:hypothetical protein